MRSPALISAALLLTQACAPASGPVPNQSDAADGESAARPKSATGWDLQSGGEGTALALLSQGGGTVIRLFCPAGQDRLLVNVPSFRPIGSEERLSLGSAGKVVALVADSRGDPARGGVTGSSAQPEELKQLLIGGPISASYGAQQSGPHPRPPDSLAAPFLSACLEGATAAREAAARPNAATHPCHVQGDRLIRVSMRALGTEPFWNARIDGRCVTYSTPENQSGTRLWTQYGDGPQGPIFTGAYEGKPFRLILEPRPNCSDGMSDRRYDWEARLTVGGEERRGCAETL